MRQELLQDPPRGRRRLRVLALLTVVAAGGTAATLLVGRGSDAPRRPAGAATGPTVAVTRRTLVQRSSQSGTLGYSGERTVIGRLPGTFTWLPRVGQVIRRGERLYSIDGWGVRLMYGAVPAYRTLRRAVSPGTDVLQLERNLTALGFGGMTVDREFTSATKAAVKDWQRSVGLHPTGEVRLGRILFLPGPLRVGALRATLGSTSSPAAPIMDTTSTRRVVTVRLDAAKQTLARVGARVNITLPDGRTATGRVTNVGKVASGRSTPKLPVTIHITGRRRATTLDQAPVTVDFAQSIRRHVLAVPVTALVAIAGGGYAVVLQRGRQLPVTPGMFANGYVEISGPGIHKGLRVRNT